MASPTPYSVPRSDERTTAPEPERPSVAELVADLTRETSELVRREMELARLEMSQTMSRVQTGVSSLAAGGTIAFAGVLFLLAAAALGIDVALRTPWLSALIVGGCALVIGAVLLAVGKTRLANLAPERSLRSLRRDGELVQDHLPGGGA